MSVKRNNILAFLFFFAGTYACKKEMGNSSFEGFQQPSNFPAPEYHFETNALTQAGFELGRKLFYETQLSHNNTISCGSCHIQTSAFVHPGHSVSHGIYDRLGKRNSPPIMNLAWSTSFMWDGGIFDLDLQPLAPIANHVEMDDTISNLLVKLGKTTDYPTLFQKAFGTPEITGTRFLKALAQFMVMCVSSHSKYDSVMRNEGASFTSTEQAGYVLFQQKCNSCHKEPLFTDHTFRNNGLPPSGLNDEGRYLVTLNSTDRYKFKVPSLRNIFYTEPYMHDGRYFDLEGVLEYYNSGAQNTTNLDTLLKQNGRLGIPLTSVDKTNLIAFLKTLSDRSFLLDKRFSEH